MIVSQSRSGWAYGTVFGYNYSETENEDTYNGTNHYHIQMPHTRVVGATIIDNRGDGGELILVQDRTTITPIEDVIIRDVTGIHAQSGGSPSLVRVEDCSPECDTIQIFNTLVAGPSVVSTIETGSSSGTTTGGNVVQTSLTQFAGDGVISTADTNANDLDVATLDANVGGRVAFETCWDDGACGDDAGVDPTN